MDSGVLHGVGGTGRAKRVCTSSPRVTDVIVAGSRHEVLPSSDCVGTAGAGVLGSLLEVAAAPVSKGTQGVAVNPGLQHEVAPVEAADCQVSKEPSQGLLVSTCATTAAMQLEGRAASEWSPRPLPNEFAIKLGTPLIDVAHPVSSEGGAVAIDRPRPFASEPASPQPPVSAVSADGGLVANLASSLDPKAAIHLASAQELTPETLAQQLLSIRDFSADSVLRLIDLLPRVSGLRRVQGQGGTKAFPHVCEFLCTFIHHICPQHVFSAFDVLDDVLSDVHQDSMNEKGSRSLVIPITRFDQGQLWYESAGGEHEILSKGKTLRGTLHDLSLGPCFFDPHVKHAVLPWHGRRVTVVAYQPRSVDEAQLALRALSFRVCP